jgi:hypothetical protein
MKSLPKFRCSSWGNLMAEPKLKADKDAGNLSEGAKTHASDVFVSWHYNRREDTYSKYFEKGNAVEEDAITLVSVQTGIFHKKNETNLSNEFLTGTPDLYIGSDGIEKAEIIEDTKAAWDVFTFQRTKLKGESSLNYWQMQGYMALTGAKLARLRFCLVNSTPDLIDDEKRKLAYAMRVMDRDSDATYIEKCAQIERNMIYDLGLFLKHNPNYDLSFPVSEWSYDIPAGERLYTIEIPRNDDDILSGYEKVKKAWLYIQSLLA